jgi:hypothetical protein
MASAVADLTVFINPGGPHVAMTMRSLSSALVTTYFIKLATSGLPYVVVGIVVESLDLRASTLSVDVGEFTEVRAFAMSIEKPDFSVEVGESRLGRQGFWSSDDIKCSRVGTGLERLTPDVISLMFVV